MDSKGIVKLRRSTRVYKKVYAVNVRSRFLKRLIHVFRDVAKRLFKKELAQVFCDDELMKSLA